MSSSSVRATNRSSSSQGRPLGEGPESLRLAAAAEHLRGKRVRGPLAGGRLVLPGHDLRALPQAFALDLRDHAVAPADFGLERADLIAVLHPARAALGAVAGHVLRADGLALPALALGQCAARDGRDLRGLLEP